MTTQDEHKAVAEKALQNMEWLVNNFTSDQATPQKSPIDKHEFVQLLQKNFEKLDRDNSDSISRREISAALADLADYTANEYVMRELLTRYFDFISELVDDDDGEEKVISRSDVQVLGQFLLDSNMTLEALYMWCSGPSGPPKADLIKPPPMSGDD